MASKKTKSGTPSDKVKGRHKDKGVNAGDEREDLRNDDDEDDGKMSVVKQATLINYHLAIEDSVDIDKIWDEMQAVFDENEQRDIQTQGSQRAKMRKLLDLLPDKTDHAFSCLVTALQADYSWLALRLQQGVQDEEQRVKKLGKGIKRKIALALLTARISERQKDVILERVTSVVETEMTQKANRVSIPDHRAAAQLDSERRALQELIREEVDPLIYGENVTSPRTTEDYDDAVNVLRVKLEQLQVLGECYAAVNMERTTSSSLPTLLLEKTEALKAKVASLQQEKQDAVEESQRLTKENDDHHLSLSRLQQHNRNLEMENRTLETECKTLQQSVRKQQESKKGLEKDHERVVEERRNLLSEVQLVNDRLSEVMVRNKTLDTHNTKLTRDNLKLTAANAALRRESRNKGMAAVATVRSENRLLTSERALIKKELQHLEAEKRQLVIRCGKLQSENRNLREQRQRLQEDKKRSKGENAALKKEARRLALGKYSPLPPITEREEDDVRRTLRSEDLASESRKTNGNVARRDGTRESNSVGNKPKEESNRAEAKDRRRDHPKRDADNENEEVGDDVQKTPSYMKATSSSKKHHYLDEEGRGHTSPRRPAAWK